MLQKTYIQGCFAQLQASVYKDDMLKLNMTDIAHSLPLALLFFCLI